MSNGCSGIRITLAPPAMPGVQRDPAGVPAHHLDDQRPVVRLGRGVQPVDRLHRDVDRGVEAERVVGRGRGRCRWSWARRRPARRRRRAAWRRRGCPRRRSRSARRRRPRPASAWIRSGPPSTLNGLVREEPRIVPPRGRMPRTGSTSSGPASPVERAPPAVAEADELVPVGRDALAHDRPDDRVQPGAVAAAGEHADPHRCSFLSLGLPVRRSLAGRHQPSPGPGRGPQRGVTPLSAE